MSTKIEQAHEAGYVTGAEAAEIVGLSYRRLDRAAATGTAPPAIDADGSGTLRRYDLDALARLKVVAALFDLGLPFSARGSAADLHAMLDWVDWSGGPTSLIAGPVTVTIDPSVARAELEPKYRETIAPPDPTGG